MNRIFNFALAACVLAGGPAFADIHSFAGLSLDGSQANPPTASTGTGAISATYDDVSNQLAYTLDWTLDAGSTELSAAHFHGPAAAGSSAGVQIGIVLSPLGVTGSISGAATLDETQEADLLAGLWYVNLHSDQFPGGEIRAQMIQSASVTHMIEAAPLGGDQEVPPVAGAGTGALNATYDDVSNELAFSMTWSGLTGPLRMAHFHGPAGPGASAGVQIGLSGFDQADAGSFSGVVTLDAAQETDLLAGLWYLNLHTDANGGGEIRGQAVVSGPSAVSDWASYE